MAETTTELLNIAVAHPSLHGYQQKKTPPIGASLLGHSEDYDIDIYVYDSIGIPPLLWSPEYTWEELTRNNNGTTSEDDADKIEAFITGLHHHQDPLLVKRHGHNYSFIITKRALPPPDSIANRELLGRLLSLETSIRVLTDCCLQPIAAETSFAIHSHHNDGKRVIAVTTTTANLVATSPQQTAAYEERFDHMSDHSQPLSAHLLPLLINT